MVACICHFTRACDSHTVSEELETEDNVDAEREDTTEATPSRRWRDFPSVTVGSSPATRTLGSTLVQELRAYMLVSN